MIKTKKVLKKKMVKEIKQKGFTQLKRMIKTSKNQPKWYKKMFEGWLH